MCSPQPAQVVLLQVEQVIGEHMVIPFARSGDLVAGSGVIHPRLDAFADAFSRAGAT